MFHSEEYDTTNSFSNGTFTAPVSGIYRFDAILALNIPQGVRSIARFVIGDNDKNRFYDGSSAGVAGVVMSGSLEVSMTAGQTARVEAWKASGDGTQVSNSFSSFSGRLVLPT